MTDTYIPNDRHAALVERIITLIENPEDLRDPGTGQIDAGRVAADLGLNCDLWPSSTRVDVEADVMEKARRRFLDQRLTPEETEIVAKQIVRDTLRATGVDLADLGQATNKTFARIRQSQALAPRKKVIFDADAEHAAKLLD